ncbi:MAG: hypothetical protein QXF15_02980 [Candidatus Aenigmatarchaeota archaeon]
MNNKSNKKNKITTQSEIREEYEKIVKIVLSFGVDGYVLSKLWKTGTE